MENHFDRTSPAYSLSSDDMMEGMKGKCTMYFYRELLDFDNVEQVLDSHGKCIILYESAKNYGHWCCLFYTPDRDIEFFDSYGYVMDDELEFGDKYYERTLGKGKTRVPHVSLLMLKYIQRYPDRRAIYNERMLQEMEDGINTCGRWVLCRLWMRNISIEKFWEVVKNDKIATGVTNKLLGWDETPVKLYDITPV